VSAVFFLTFSLWIHTTRPTSYIKDLLNAADEALFFKALNSIPYMMSCMRTSMFI